jgi:hypothetical protein
MKVTNTQLHKMICDEIEDFEDADMYFSNDEINIDDGTWKRIEEAKKLGYLSIDDPQGHEIYHCEIK